MPLKGFERRDAMRGGQSPEPEISRFVEVDLSCLRVHMAKCAAARGRFPRVRSMFDSAKSFMSTRIVSCTIAAFVLIIALRWLF